MTFSKLSFPKIIIIIVIIKIPFGYKHFLLINFYSTISLLDYFCYNLKILCSSIVLLYHLPELCFVGASQVINLLAILVELEGRHGLYALFLGHLVILVHVNLK